MAGSSFGEGAALSAKVPKLDTSYIQKAYLMRDAQRQKQQEKDDAEYKKWIDDIHINSDKVDRWDDDEARKTHAGYINTINDAWTNSPHTFANKKGIAEAKASTEDTFNSLNVRKDAFKGIDATLQKMEADGTATPEVSKLIDARRTGNQDDALKINDPWGIVTTKKNERTGRVEVSAKPYPKVDFDKMFKGDLNDVSSQALQSFTKMGNIHLPKETTGRQSLMNILRWGCRPTECRNQQRQGFLV